MRKELLILVLLSGMTFASAHAQEQASGKVITDKSEMENILGKVRTEYKFKHADTPRVLEPFSATVYSASDKAVRTMHGDEIKNFRKQIAGFGLNPSGASYVVITRDKKNRVALAVYETFRPEHRLFKFDEKLYGTPSAAVFSADARSLFVATDKGLYEFESRKFKPVGKYDIPFAPASMKASGNGYFLAMTDGEKAGIFNLQNKKMRTVLDLGDTIADAAFSPDSGMLAVLTEDGVLNIYDTRTFSLRTSFDNLEGGKACSFNDTGKYIAVATSGDTALLINIVRDDKREEIAVPDNMLADLAFIRDASGNPILAYTAENSIEARRLLNLEPYYARLISDKADDMMAEWMKMQPGETMEAYQLRMENQAKQRRLFEDELATGYAGDKLSMSAISLGGYDRGNGRLELGFSNMPPIYLPVAETDVLAFSDPSTLQFSEARYGLTADDNFELVYAKIYNSADGKTYIYDNIDRVPMNFMRSDDNVVSIDVLRQQQMDEIRLQEIRQQVVDEAKHSNFISDHTNISVDSRVVPDYNADGERILNYIVKFTYNVDPGFSAAEDFAPGKYKVGESNAASSMLKIVKEAFEGDFAQYLKPGKAVDIAISGTADATPIIRKIPYDGSLGEFENEPVSQNGQMTAITVTSAGGISTNEQLAFVRAAAVSDFLKHNVRNLDQLKQNYRYNVDVSQDKGSEYRRITAEFTFIDAFDNK